MSRQEERVVDCPECASELLHCHFMLILHFHDDPECSSGTECDSAPDMHVASISCRELIPPCGC